MDIFEFIKIDPANTKVHLAVKNIKSKTDVDPLQAYFEGDFKLWQERQSQKNFGCKYILSLIKKPNSNEWLFVGVYRVKNVKKGTISNYLYETELCDNGKEFKGRLIVDYQKTARNSYLYGDKVEQLCRISAILSDKLICAKFENFWDMLIKRYELE